MLHKDSSVSSKGSLNLEGVVRPAGRSREVIPEDGTARTIFLYDRKALISVFKSSEDFTSEPAVETLNAKTSEEVPKIVKKDNGASIIED
nr:hypothetical protein [Tanacetum cinerariifolium]